MQGANIISIESYKNKKKEKRQQKREYHRSDMKPSRNCCNSDSYGGICVRCVRCGRKF